MRTTITLEDDLYVLLEKRRAEEGKSFKQMLNEVLRAGFHLDAADAGASRQRAETATFDMGTPLIGNMDNIGDLMAIAEGEDHK